jgi:PPOX class probable F420-dependent enzyme
MSDPELRRFLAEGKIVTCATLGPRGRPHVVPLWYVPDDTTLRGWTYAKSQKARNLARDPHATLQVEDGVRYEELRGIMLECDVEVDRDPEQVTEYGLALFRRYVDPELGADARAAVEQQAPKRVGLTFRPTRTVSWDHSKLGGSY